MKGGRTRRTAVVILVAAITAAACSGRADALVDAQLACGADEAPATSAPGWDIDALGDDELRRNAERAAVRAAAASRAAAADDRWGALADALGEIATLAARIADASAAGRSPSAELTESDWYAYKAASNASVLECRTVAARAG